MADEEVTTLPTLNNDCLEYMILYLDVKTMLIWAATDNLLQNVVVSAYHRRFGRKTVWLNSNGSPRNVIDENQKRIMIEGTRYCFPFLRLFGAKILALVVADDRNIHVDRYISQYCSNTLTSITFNYRSEFSADDFLHPFNCVETVRIIECDLGPHLRCFTRWFPNLRRLKIYKGSRDNRLNRIHFPHLQVLNISFVSMKMLQANPQLLSFERSGGRPIIFLDEIIMNRSLSKLTMRMGSSLIAMNTGDVKRLFNEHPSLVELNLQQCRFTANDAIALIRRLNSLKKFQFQPYDRLEYKDLLQRLSREWRCQPHKYNSKVLILER